MNYIKTWQKDYYNSFSIKTVLILDTDIFDQNDIKKLLT